MLRRFRCRAAPVRARRWIRRQSAVRIIATPNTPEITERDLNNAQKLGINQIRCFITYQAYTNNPEQFRKNLLHLVRAADQRGIGVIPVVGYTRQMMTNEGHPGAEDWAKFLVDTLGKEPGLAFWDVCNEPDYPSATTNA